MASKKVATATRHKTYHFLVQESTFVMEVEILE